MKTRIIDILNKIANGEKPPKKIIFREQEYEYDIGERDYYYCNGAIYWLFDEYVITDILNDEVEILETTITYKPDKIGKLTYENTFENNSDMEVQEVLANKINEIIEVLNER
jgi:hypothetical protein